MINYGFIISKGHKNNIATKTKTTNKKQSPLVWNAKKEIIDYY